jgi:UDP-4-amino-4,6-dideoxy-N-acetyl-beta-L-altrosamine N-acetyltransferase
MRVCLSSIRPEDSEVLFRWINDPETVRFNAPYKPVHWASHEDWVRSLGAAPDRHVFVIRVDARPVGVVQLVDIDPIHRSAELTIRIGEDVDRGRGTGTEALRLAVGFAWRDLNLHRVWARVFATNARAIRAFQKAGFVDEGTLREAAHIGGRYVDVRVFGMVRKHEG